MIPAADELRLAEGADVGLAVAREGDEQLAIGGSGDCRPSDVASRLFADDERMLLQSHPCGLLCNEDAEKGDKAAEDGCGGG
jgi:hypothetical protein